MPCVLDSIEQLPELYRSRNSADIRTGLNYHKKGAHSGTPCYRLPDLGKITTSAVLLYFCSALGRQPQRSLLSGGQ